MAEPEPIPGAHSPGDETRKLVEEINDMIARSREREQPGEREITVLLAKLYHFPSLVQDKSPTEIADFVNRYLVWVLPPILKYQGDANQYVNGAIFATFGMSIPWPEHRKNAVAAALEIQDTLKAAKLPFTLTINSGLAFVGNIGIEEWLRHTALGSMINSTFLMSDRQKPNTIIILGQRIDQDQTILDLIQDGPYSLNVRRFRSNLGPAYQIRVLQKQAAATS